jgi:2-dehydro-3-deoxyphosphogluconate aldolase/(4S)-4-hydroxy-2-oxoglutarate aldolase
MTDRPAIPELVLASRVIAIGRNVPAADAPSVGEAFVAGGVHVMELTLNEPEADALRAIAALAAVADDLGALVGAGTVLSIGAAKRAVDAGARFIVSPHTDAELIAWCALSGVPCFPGALSPTEIHTAWSAGASAVKLFPAAAVGTGYLKQIAGPFPGIPFVPTGGVSAETAGDWIVAGAVAVGMGGWLIGDGEPAGITERSRQVQSAVSR